MNLYLTFVSIRLMSSFLHYGIWIGYFVNAGLIHGGNSLPSVFHLLESTSGTSNLRSVNIIKCINLKINILIVNKLIHYIVQR